MSRFKQKEKRTVPQPPSGSLSDIVFMLLFFFMVTTTMRETENKVMVKLPEASEVAKLGLVIFFAASLSQIKDKIKDGRPFGLPSFTFLGYGFYLGVEGRH